MTNYRNLIVEALIELADGSYQERIWTGAEPAEMSSFSECIERLFDDSGLTLALSRGNVFGPEVDAQLRTLGELADSVDALQPVGQLLQDPKLAECRRLSREILRRLPAPAS